MSPEETRSPDEAPDRGGRSAAQMVGVGVVASAIGIAIGLADRLVPGAGLDPGRADRHAVGRPDHRVGADVRARHGRRGLLGPRLPHAPGRGATSTGRRSTATPAWRSSGPRSRRSSSSACASTRTSCSSTSRRRRPTGRARRHASPASSSPGRSSTTRAGGKPFNSTQLYLPEGQSVKFDITLARRHPRLLGTGVPHEDRRGAGHHDELPRHAEAPGQLPRRLRGAVRAGPRLHAPDRARARARGRSTRGCGSASRPAAGGRRRRGRRRRRRRRRQRSTPRRSSRTATSRPARRPAARCHTLADAGTTRRPGPNLDEVLKGKDAAFIKRSRSSSPNAEIAKGFGEGIMPAELRRDPVARAESTRSWTTSGG